MNSWWSWLLTSIGIAGLYLAGKKIWWSWLIGLGAQALWIIYAITTNQYGFIASAFSYSFVYARNAREWYKSSGEMRNTALELRRIAEELRSAIITPNEARQRMYEIRDELYRPPKPITDEWQHFDSEDTVSFPKDGNVQFWMRYGDDSPRETSVEFEGAVDSNGFNPQLWPPDSCALYDDIDIPEKSDQQED